MPPKNIAHTYIELLTRGEKISNATLRRENSRSPLIPAQVLFEQYGSWYQDVAQYFDVLGDEASSLLHRYELTYIPSAEKEGNLFYHYTSKQLSERVDELRLDVNKIKKAVRKSRPYLEEKVSITDTEILVERKGYSLRFNILTADEKFKKLKDGTENRYVYYGCTKFKDKHCKCGYVREEDLIEQLANVLDTVSLDKIGMRDQIKTKLRLHNEFQQSVLGQKVTEDVKVKEIDVRNYAKHILRTRPLHEKRELLCNLKSKLILENKIIYIKKS